MKAVNIHDAKTQFSKLIDRAMQGEEVIIAKAGKPVVKLVSLSAQKKLQLGLLKGKISISDDFDAPLPDEVLKSFEGDD